MRHTKPILLTAGLLLLLNTAVLATRTNFNAGLVLIALAGISLILYALLARKLARIKWLTALILSGFSLIAGVTIFLAVYGNIDTCTFAENAVIVLGAGSKDGIPAPQLAFRLDKAVEYHARNPGAVIVVSGGLTEALVMEKYLLDRDVPPGSILREEMATDTYENFAFSKRILDEYFQREYDVVYITNHFHIFRAGMIAKTLEIDAAHLHARLLWYDLIANYLRECGAIVREIFLGRMF